MSYWYLATPYSNYPGGREKAFVEACFNAALLMDAGIPVFCPIAHSHPISEAMNASPTDHELWVKLDQPLLEAAMGGIFVEMPGFEDSRGMLHEFQYFCRASKPIIWMRPGILPSLAELA